MSQWKIVRDPWRYWGQLSDPPPQGLDDRNRQNNCGAECTSMLLEYVTGVELSAAVIKDMMRGDDYVGYLSWGDMAYFWSRFCGTRTFLIANDNQDAFQRAIFTAMMQGHTCQGLYYFTAPDSNDAHFRVITELHGNGYQLDTVVTADPMMPGKPRIETADEHWNWSKNQALVIERQRSIKP